MPDNPSPTSLFDAFIAEYWRLAHPGEPPPPPSKPPDWNKPPLLVLDCTDWPEMTYSWTDYLPPTDGDVASADASWFYDFPPAPSDP